MWYQWIPIPVPIPVMSFLQVSWNQTYGRHMHTRIYLCLEEAQHRENTQRKENTQENTHKGEHRQGRQTEHTGTRHKENTEKAYRENTHRKENTHREQSGTIFSIKYHVFYEGGFQNQALRVGVGPKRTRDVSFWGSVWCLCGVPLAPLPHQTQVSENHPCKTYGL